MININIFNDRYKKLIPDTNREHFTNEVNSIKSSFDLQELRSNNSVLLYSKRSRAALIYMLSLNYSIGLDKILNYEVISSTTYERQHFLNNDRDDELYESVYYCDILYITMSTDERLTELMEKLLIDIVEFRDKAERITIIHVDTSFGGTPNVKLERHFQQSDHLIVKDTSFTTQHSAVSTPKSSSVQATGQVNSMRPAPPTAKKAYSNTKKNYKGGRGY